MADKLIALRVPGQGILTVRAASTNLARQYLNIVRGIPAAAMQEVKPADVPAGLKPVNSVAVTDQSQLELDSGNVHPVILAVAQSGFPPGSRYSYITPDDWARFERTGQLPPPPGGSPLGEGEQPGLNDQAGQPTPEDIERARQAELQRLQDQTLAAQGTAGGGPIGGEGEGFFPTNGVLPSGSENTGQVVPTPENPLVPDPFLQGQIADFQQRIDALRSVNPGVADFVQSLLSGNYTPEELQAIIANPQFQALFTDPDLAEFLGPSALNAFASIVNAQAIAGAGIQEAQITANPFGLSQEQALDLQRIQASGGLSDPAQIFDILQQNARGAIDNPFASLNSGAGLDAISQILRGGLTPEQQVALARAQQEAQLQQNFLNFIGNPSAVGSAVGFGFNPFGGAPTGQPPQAQPLPPGFTAPVPPSARPLPARAPFDLPQGGLATTGTQQLLAGGFGVRPPVQRTPFSGGDLAMTNAFQPNNAQAPQLQATPFSGRLAPTQALGSFRGVGANANEASFRDFSDEERQFFAGQQAARGITPSGTQRRVRSFTPGGERRAVASGF